MKDELLTENNDLKIKIDLAFEEVERLKCNNLDSDKKDEVIAELSAKIEKMEMNQHNNQYEADFAKISFENAKLKASQIYYFNVIREILKLVKKHEHQLKNALSLLSQEDSNEVESILKDFKITY